MPSPNRRYYQPDFETGLRLTSADLNAIVRNLFTKIVGGAGVLVRHAAGQVVISLVKNEKVVDEDLYLQVETELGDYLVCHHVDAQGNVGSANVYVLKRWDLRTSPFSIGTHNGFTYSYTSVNERTSTKVSDESTESQKISPDYYNGAKITARRQNVYVLLSGGAGDGEYTNLVDNSHRQWAVPEEE